MVAVGKGYHKLPFILGYLLMEGKNSEIEKCNAKKECVNDIEPALTETSIQRMRQIHASRVSTVCLGIN